MPGNYYYFIASLPHVNYGDKPPFSSNEFRAQCDSFLSRRDAALANCCNFDPKLIIETDKPTGSAFIDFILLRERVVNQTLANLRAAKLKRPSPVEHLLNMPRAESVAKAAFEMDDPLEAELYLDRSRWGFLNEIVDDVSYFSVNTIFAYLFKMQLLERKQVYDAIKGAEAYKEHYNTILKNFNNMVKED